MKLVGIHGHAGVGKNTFAEEFHYAGFFEYSFASPIKQACVEIFGLSALDFIDRDRKEAVIDYWNYSPRQLAQYVGAEMFRQHFGPNIWIKSLQARIVRDLGVRKEENRKVVITDVRFQNEANWIRESGGIIVHLTRPGFEGNVGIPGHESEKQLDFSQFTKGENYYEINNSGTITDLQIAAHKFIADINL